MNALAKFSIALLLPTATATAGYLYLESGDEGFDAARSQPLDEICKQDTERLARLRAKPSLDEGLKLVGEIRCLQVWPQLRSILDGLSDPSRSTTASSLNAVRSDTRSASDAAASIPAPEPTSAALDDACKRDEDRLAELRAKPSIGAAIRFDSELRCPRLQPQLPGVLERLSHAGGSDDPASRNVASLKTTTVGETAPPSSSPSRASAKPDDTCARDAKRLADLQAKPSLDEAVRFEDELKCSKLQPQLLALLDSLSQAPQSGAPTPNGTPVDTTAVGETAPPSSESPATEGAAATPDDACKRDENRLDQLRHNPSSEEVARFAEELSCEKLRPQLLALVGDLAKAPPPGAAEAAKDGAAKTTMSNETSHAETRAASDASATSEAAADPDRGIATLKLDRDTLDAKVDRLESHVDSDSVKQAAPPESPQPAGSGERSDSEPASQAIVAAERRIAALERETDALAAEVKQLGRHQGSSPEQVASQTPPSVATTSPASTSSTPPVGPPNSEEAALDPQAGAALASLPNGMPARVLIRYPRNNADARRQAESLADALKRPGVEVADLRESDGAVRTGISFFYARDASVAQEIGALVGIVPALRPQMRDGLMARPGAIELSFSGDSHLPVITTSRKEPVHE
jgi:hypothetical protein